MREFNIKLGLTLFVSHEGELVLVCGQLSSLCVCACVRVCVRACVRAWVGVCVCVGVSYVLIVTVAVSFPQHYWRMPSLSYVCILRISVCRHSATHSRMSAFHTYPYVCILRISICLHSTHSLMSAIHTYLYVCILHISVCLHSTHSCISAFQNIPLCLHSTYIRMSALYAFRYVCSPHISVCLHSKYTHMSVLNAFPYVCILRISNNNSGHISPKDEHTALNKINKMYTLKLPKQ